MASESEPLDLRRINRTHLNGASAEIYDAIYDGIESFSDTVNIAVETGDVDLKEVFNAVMLDCPSTYYIHPTSPFSYRRSEEGLTIWINNIYKGEELATLKRILEKEIKRVSELCLAECTTDLEKELYIHDHLANTIEYTHDTVVADLSEYSAVGALIDRKAVCMGIAKAACVLLNSVGVETGCVYNEDHMWNVVRIDGKTYNLDVTWDLKGETTRHDYFNLSDRRIMADHELGNGPVCCSDDLSWFNLNGLELHTLEELLAVIEKCIEEGRRNIEVRMPQTASGDIRVFLEDVIGELSLSSLNYEINERQSIIRFTFCF